MSTVTIWKPQDATGSDADEVFPRGSPVVRPDGLETTHYASRLVS
jgi:hypothetical protein